MMLGLLNRICRRKSKGQAMVEMALVLPFLLMMLLGIIEFGRIFNAYLTITYAAREAARVGALGQDDVAITNRADAVAVGLDTSRLTVETTPDPASRQYGGVITVHVRYSLPLDTPFFGALLPNPFPLEAQTVMRIE